MVMVSVIIPAYNSEAYLREALDSVLNQTWQDLEVLVVDDGSTDGTMGIAYEYMEKHPDRVRYFYQQNRGPGAARNLGLRNARGRYIAFIDGDDAWLPAKLARQVPVLEKDPRAGLVYCDNYFIDAFHRIVVPGRVRRFPLPRGRITLEFFYHYFMFTSTVLMRREVVDRVGYFREDIFVGEDYDYFLRVSYAYPIELLDEKLVEKRSIEESLSNQDIQLNHHNDLILMTDFIRSHPEYYRENRAVLANKLATYHFSLGYYWLRHGRNLRSVPYFLGSLRYKPMPKTLKCLLLCAVPYRLIRSVKKALFRSRYTVEDEKLSREGARK